MNTTILRITTIFLSSKKHRSGTNKIIPRQGKRKSCSAISRSLGSLKGRENPRSEGVRDFITGRLTVASVPSFPWPLIAATSPPPPSNRFEKERERERDVGNHPRRTVQNCMHEKMHSFVEHVIGSPCEESKGE